MHNYVIACIYVCMYVLCMHVLCVCVILTDDGPQVKKLSMEDPQAVAQAAIAKFVDNFVHVYT